MAKHDILLIGDGTNLLKTIGWVLEHHGFAVKVTAKPEAALEAMVKKNYDLVIGRLTPDDVEILDIFKRSRRLNPEVKLMAVSDHQDGIFPLEAYQVDIDDYLLMPVSPVELWRRVHYCLQDLEMVDLQPKREAAASPRPDALPQPQLMLMLHDIRGAMVSTAATLKLMSRGLFGELSEPARAKLREATGRFEKMILQTEGFIGRNLAGSPAGARDRKLLDLTEDIVEPVLDELADDIRDHQITLLNRLPDHLGHKISVRGSKLDLQSVFRNLIDNAVKYGGRGCTIIVDFELQGASGRLHVYNTGQTVPEAYRSMLFSYSRTTRRPKQGHDGLGLGLSLSRELMQNYGGDIWYEAKTDGSNFVVSLP
jgi:signal transduction histidine kinase